MKKECTWGERECTECIPNEFQLGLINDKGRAQERVTAKKLDSQRASEVMQLER